MSDETHHKRLEQIFASLDPDTLHLKAREGPSVEFKQSFNWGSRAQYAKSMAAFANNRGGYLVFGVTNSPRNVVGLTGRGFEERDEATITGYLNGAFAPAIEYEKFAYAIAGLSVGVIYVSPHHHRPIVAIKSDDPIVDGEIYFRYNARSDRIRHPELQQMLEQIRARERNDWMSLLEKIGRIGPANAGVVDVVDGTIEGRGGSLLIDSKLAAKLKFIREGDFKEAGKPTLKLIGDVVPVALTAVQGRRRAVRLTDDPSAPSVREESVLDNYPLDHRALIKELKRRYSDFKQDGKFLGLKAKLCVDERFCKVRLLDPNKPRGWDFTPEIDLRALYAANDDDREGLQAAHRRAVAVWKYMPRAKQVRFAVESLIRYEDIALVDAEGDRHFQIPHLFVDFAKSRGPFRGEWSRFVVDGPRGNLRHFNLPDDWRRAAIFPKKFPNKVVRPKLREDVIVSLDAESLKNFLEYKNDADTLYTNDGRYDGLSARDVVRVHYDGDERFLEVTHIERSSLASYMANHSDAWSARQIAQRQLGGDPSDDEEIVIVETQRSYPGDWK